MPDPWIPCLRFSNGAAGDLLLWLEPWAEEFTIPPRAELALWCDIDSPIEAEITPDGLAAYAGPGSRIRVEIDGVIQESGSADLAVPGLPPGLPTRGFIATAFGDVRDEAVPARPKRSWLRRLFGQ